MEHVQRTVRAMQCIFEHFVTSFDEVWTDEERLMAAQLLFTDEQLRYFSAKGILRVPDVLPSDLGPLDDIKVTDGEDEEEDDDE